LPGQSLSLLEPKLRLFRAFVDCQSVLVSGVFWNDLISLKEFNMLGFPSDQG